MRLSARRGVSRGLVVIAAFVVLAIAVGFFAYRESNRKFTVLEMHGGPIVTTSGPTGDVVALTSHWESQYFSSSSDNTVQVTTTLHWDLWSFSTADLSRKWVTRLASVRKGARRVDAGILGAFNGTVWLLADQLVAVSIVDGHVIGDVAAIEEKNPFLRGSMPDSRDQLLFDRGLIVVAADGRRWRINETTLRATPVTVGATDTTFQNGRPLLPLRLSSSFQSYKSRGYVVGDKWYGLVHPAEVQHLEREMIEQDFREPLRYTFWTASMRDTIDRFGTPFRAPKDFRPVPGSPEFLYGALLSSRDSSNKPRVIGIANPTRFIISHQTRVDRRGTQLLTCLTLDGNVCWEANLGIAEWMGMERLTAGTADDWALLMIGEQTISARNTNDTRDVNPDRDMDAAFVRVKIADGSVKRMSFGDIDLVKISDEVKPYRVVR